MGLLVLSRQCFEVERRDGTRLVVTVDAEDLDRVIDRGGWFPDRRGYIVRNMPKVERPPWGEKLHRFVLGLVPSDPGVDHRDGDKLNNRKSNLRIAGQVANGQNLSRVNSRGGSRYRGVTWHGQTQKWRAMQIVDGRQVSLGLYPTEEEAAAVLDEWRRANLANYEGR